MKQKTTISIDKDLLAESKQAAERSKRTLSNWIECVIFAELLKEEKKGEKENANLHD